MKAYISTKFENKGGFQEMKQLLEKNGHEIIYDWTVHDPTKEPPAEQEAFRRDCAATELFAVMCCDVLILIPTPEPMSGAFTELGIALGRKRVIVVNPYGEGNQNNIFYHLPIVQEGFEHARDFNHVIELLKGETPGMELDQTTVTGFN